MKLFKLALILSTIFVFFIACGQTESTKTNTNKADNSAKSIAKETPDEFAAGRKIYIDNCATCHNADGAGGEIDVLGKKVNADNLTTDKMKKMPDAKYIKYITNGIKSEGMPAFKDKLSEDEMKEVVKFIRGVFQK